MTGARAVLGPLLDRARRSRALVVGDVMLDEYVSGSVERTSPEAPVPVLRASTRSANPGGAANVARQLAVFDTAVELMGAVGDDDAGSEVLALCAAEGVGTALVETVAGATTTRKQRILAVRQQVVRIDWEEVRPLPDDRTATLFARLDALDPPDVVVVSDYAKGFVTREVLEAVMARARRWGVPVLVDPKSADLGRYRGATLVKANQLEFEAAIGRALGPDPEREAITPARMLMKEHHFPQLVITLGERGLIGLDGSADPVVVAQPPQEVFDVSGAGDTVLAVLALALMAGEPLADGARLASRAAGAVVSRAGVALARPADLVEVNDDGNKVLGADELALRLAAWRVQDRTVVFTNGCFDLLHAGHVHLLHRAAEMGDVLVVAVNTDASVRDLKGPGRPFIAEAERVALLAAIDCVDAVVVFDEPDPLDLIDVVRPDVLVKGSDYELADIVGRDVVAAAGGVVVTVPLLPGWSTSALLDRIRRPGTHL